MSSTSHYTIKGLDVKKSCKSCGAIFQSSLLDDEVYCDNCRDDENNFEGYNYNHQYDDIVNTSCRTSPVFYD